ncbi:hypothetical protein C8J57DRAFT_1517424 [Mycena rebaudengoi]|nr:hypothetical protein C8J57DRAFT_1517424 [Mycena rebaudengoi]
MNPQSCSARSDRMGEHWKRDSGTEVRVAEFHAELYAAGALQPRPGRAIRLPNARPRPPPTVQPTRRAPYPSGQKEILLRAVGTSALDFPPIPPHASPHAKPTLQRQLAPPSTSTTAYVYQHRRYEQARADAPPPAHAPELPAATRPLPSAQASTTHPRHAQHALSALHMRLKTKSTCTQHDAPFFPLLRGGIFVCFFAPANGALPSQYPCPAVSPKLCDRLCAADIALRTELLALNSALRSSKTAFVTTQDDPPNLRYAGPQHTAPDAERTQRDAERAAWAENTSWVVEHAKWDADCEIMRAEIVRGEKEQACRARGLCQERVERAVARAELRALKSALFSPKPACAPSAQMNGQTPPRERWLRIAAGKERGRETRDLEEAENESQACVLTSARDAFEHQRTAFDTERVMWDAERGNWDGG